MKQEGVEEEETQKCPNCGLFIAKSRFRLHYMGCLRQNRVKQPSPPKKLEESKTDVPEVKSMPTASANPATTNQNQQVVASSLIPQQQPQPEPHASALAGSSLMDEFQDPSSKPAGINDAECLNDYDQMIFQQFMGGEDGGNSLIRNDSLQQTGFPASQGNPGLGDGSNVRQADEAREQQLIGGDDEYSMPFRPQGGSLQFFDPGTFGTLQGPGRQANAPAGLGLQRQGAVPPSGLLTDDDVRQAQEQSLQDVAHLQALQNQLDRGEALLGGVNPGPQQQQNRGGAANDLWEQPNEDEMNAGDFMDLPDEEIDPDLQKALEESRALHQ